MKQDILLLELNRYEHGMMVTALNELRNMYIAEGKNIDFVNEVYAKVAGAPVKKKGRWRNNAR